MDETTLKALNGSIKKWTGIVENLGVDCGSYNCSLCQLFSAPPCVGCPVRSATQRSGCNGTPYIDWIDHQHIVHHNISSVSQLHEGCNRCTQLAQNELDFLISLLPIQQL